MPGPCSDEYICLLVRFATKNKKLRRKRITINKLCGMPVLFIGVEQSDVWSKHNKLQYDSEKPDSQIIKLGDRNFVSEIKPKKKKKRRRTGAGQNNEGILIDEGIADFDLGYRTLQRDDLQGRSAIDLH